MESTRLRSALSVTGLITLLGVGITLSFGRFDLPKGRRSASTVGPATSRVTSPARFRPTSRSSIPPPEGQKAHLVENFGKLPLSFEANQGQTDPQVKFISRGSGYTLFLTSSEAVLALAKSGQGLTASGRHSHATRGRGPWTTVVTRQWSSTFPSLFPSGQFLIPSPESLVPSPKPLAASPESPTPAVLRMRLVGLNPAAQVSGVEELPGKSNYYIGNDPKKWRTKVPNYAKVKYKDVYPGVDLVYHGNQQQLEYDFVVAPGADPKAIRLAMDDAVGAGHGVPLRIDTQGDLVLQAGGGELRLHKPVVYQPRESSQPSVVSSQSQRTTDRKPWTGHAAANSQFTIHSSELIEGRYVLTATNEIRFEVPTYVRTRPLIIDPVLSYSICLNCGGGSWGRDIAVYSAHNAYITGETMSVDFPTANPFRSSIAAGTCGTPPYTYTCPDAFVTKLDTTKMGSDSLIYSTYLGGSSNDWGNGIAVDSAGNAYVTGETFSIDFPTTANPFQAANAGSGDAFVTKLSAAGSELVYSTYLGGSNTGLGSGGGFGEDWGSGIAVDSEFNAYVTGGTFSLNFPHANALSLPSGMGSLDAFVTRLNAAGSGLVYSTHLGGSYGDEGRGIAVDSARNAYVTGETLSTNFPTFHAFKASNAGNEDAFVTKVDTTKRGLESVIYSTYLGGDDWDGGYGIAVDSAGNTYVTGDTSGGFPITANAVQRAYAGEGDAFVTKLDTTKSGPESLIYSTYLGGSGEDGGRGIAVNPTGNAYVTGWQWSTDFPKVDTLQGAEEFTTGSFLAKLNADGSALVFSIYLGGDGIALDSAGNAYVAGGGAFVAEIALVPAVATLSATSLTFLNEAVGTTSQSKTVKLTNTGGATLRISSIDRSGDFAQNNDCASSVAGGAYCTIGVTFTPMASGFRPGTLTITDNAAGSPHKVALYGNWNFSLRVQPQGTAVSPGGQATFAAILQPLGFIGPVRVSFGGATGRLTCGSAFLVCSTSPSVVTLDGVHPRATRVRVKTNWKTPRLAYTVQVIASAGELRQTATFTLAVR